jgi:hypothetical protein
MESRRKLVGKSIRTLAMELTVGREVKKDTGDGVNIRQGSQQRQGLNNGLIKSNFIN